MATWWMCTCQHYRTRHVLKDTWDRSTQYDAGECLVTGCRCTAFVRDFKWNGMTTAERSRKYRRIRQAKRRADRERAEHAGS